MYKSSAQTLVSLRQAQGKGLPQHPTQNPMRLRTRQNITLDPAVQQHLEWLSPDRKTYFSSSSSSTRTEKPNVVEFFVCGPSMARLALSRVARQRIVLRTSQIFLLSGSFASRQWQMPCTRREVYRQHLTVRTRALVLAAHARCDHTLGSRA